jgi:hypothetical protein
MKNANRISFFLLEADGLETSKVDTHSKRNEFQVNPSPH